MNITVPQGSHPYENNSTARGKANWYKIQEFMQNHCQHQQLFLTTSVSFDRSRNIKSDAGSL